MNTYTITGAYTISVTMQIKAESEEEALAIAEDYGDGCIETEWNGNSVFADIGGAEGVEEITLEADGTLYDITCTDSDEEDDEGDED